ncbi:type II toxin-antitoxin system RelE/ParE family toxin [Aurantimonas endophytica]|uniref:Plasmid stabilization system protein ParE n=1 Tax=Aurantimonas endophytica TaxID=1522175 RepID=A0A7W6HEZ0_9HYPH|nr:type II toxin-antitoxin system RelE/ParE family toxin [Aurantimonas endophytica]MBB4003953.1 plasmid stabilization system protein ParE [Aurantimonas endophytica]MCO6404803.1 type II toxin-antitoxin system RelE/ParE family toxin [Aurantimonas endophytica]
MRLRYTETALRQIDEALFYKAAQSPRVAARFSKRILAATALIEADPNAAQATSRSRTRRVFLAPYPYFLFYHVAADEVVITRLRHAARKPLPRFE